MGGSDGPVAWRWPNLEGGASAMPDDEFIPTPLVQAGAESQEEPEEPVRAGHREAARLLEQAREDAQRIRRRARAQALAEARRRLDAALEESVREQTHAFTRARDELLAELREAYEEGLAQIERELAPLVAQMAEKVIRRKVAEEDGVVLDVVRATVERAAGAKRLSVRVAASDEELVRQAQAELLAAGGAEELEIVADESIGPGGCIVETERGRFDARIQTQIELLGDEVGRVLGQS